MRYSHLYRHETNTHTHTHADTLHAQLYFDYARFWYAAYLGYFYAQQCQIPDPKIQ